MAYGTPADPVAGTVITVAYAVSNVLDPIRWLRLLTGNADPPGSAYVVVSTSTTGTNWAKVTTDVMADGAITLAKMGAASVSTTQLVDGSVTAAKMAVNAIGTNAIQDTAVTAAKIFDGAVGTDELASGSVTAAKMAVNSVSTNAIQDTAITAAKIFDGAVTAAKIGSGAVTDAKMAVNAIGTNAIQDTAVTAAKLFAGAAASNLGYTPARIESGTYTGNDAATRTISTSGGFTPKFVVVHRESAGVGIYHNNGYRTTLTYSGNAIVQATGNIVSGGFEVYAGGNNANGVTYYYTAIG